MTAQTFEQWSAELADLTGGVNVMPASVQRFFYKVGDAPADLVDKLMTPTDRGKLMRQIFGQLQDLDGLEAKYLELRRQQ